MGWIELERDFNGSRGLRPEVGVRVGVPPTAVREATNVGGRVFGISKPRSFKLINLHAILNSPRVIFPSESVSARALKIKEDEKIIMNSFCEKYGCKLRLVKTRKNRPLVHHVL